MGPRSLFYWEFWSLSFWWASWSLADTYLLPYSPWAELVVLGFCTCSAGVVRWYYGALGCNFSHGERIRTSIKRYARQSNSEFGFKHRTHKHKLTNTDGSELVE